MRIAVLSDIHSAAEPFAKALDAARSAGFDLLVINGDLFTYGVEPEACLALLHDALATDVAILIEGNHDRLYRDMEEAKFSYLDALPEWIRESVLWTFARLETNWGSGLPWRADWSRDDLLIAHANPHGANDWRYLRSDADFTAAVAALEARGFRHGVFGHVHRPRHHAAPQGITIDVVGSLGQPREPYGRPQWMMIDYRSGGLETTVHQVEFDTHHHIAKLQSAGLTGATAAKLGSFFLC